MLEKGFHERPICLSSQEHLGPKHSILRKGSTPMTAGEGDPEVQRREIHRNGGVVDGDEQVPPFVDGR